MSELPQLRASLLAAAERQAQRRGDPRVETNAHGLPPARRSPTHRLLARRGSLALTIPAGLLAAAAVAFATTQLIPTGAPVLSEERFAANVGVGVAIPRSTGLLGIAAPDPAGGPPWTMRVYDTSRGLGCAQVGRLVEGRIGVLGEDGAFHDDGRFHPLPTQASQAEGHCVLLDARGHAFMGVATYDEPASGLPRECHLLDSHAASRSCARSDPRDVFYGLLGPDARSITYTAEGHTRTVPTVGPDGAYLIVERAPARLADEGAEVGGVGALPAGGGSVAGRGFYLLLDQPIRRIAYAGGRSCTIPSHGEGARRGCHTPVGYVPAHIHVPSARELASTITAHVLPDQLVESRHDPRQAELLVSFVAHVAVTSALSGYSVFVEPPRTGSCAAFDHGVGAGGELGRNVTAGEHVQVRVQSGWGSPASPFPECPGTGHGTVIYSIPSSELAELDLFMALGPQRPARVTVGRFTYENP
jgi:hypothetical protein